jgi:hypothetical protein
MKPRKSSKKLKKAKKLLPTKPLKASLQDFHFTKPIDRPTP